MMLTLWLSMIAGIIAVQPTAQNVTRSFSDLTVSVLGNVPEYTLRVEDRPSGERHERRLHSATPISRIARWKNRLTLYGGDYSSGAQVFDLGRWSVVDEILGQMLTVSPDGRFIAYRRMVPRNIDEPPVYIVYDVIGLLI